MKTIVIYADGTLGDHLPSIALGQALAARGYHVRMAINRAMHAYAQRAGLEAIALTDIERGPAEARRNAWAWNHWRDPATAVPADFTPLSPDDLVTQARDLIEICRGADLLLATSIRILGYCAHQATDIPWITFSLNPSVFYRHASDDEQAAEEVRRRQAYAPVQELLGYMFGRLNVDKPVPDWRPDALFARHILLACSPHFSAPDLEQFQPRTSLDLTGFWLYQDADWQTWQPSPDLARFCERQPIALSFSSQPLEEKRQTLAKHVHAARQLGRPLLVQRGWADFSEEDLPADADRENIRFADFIPHDWLFAHVTGAIQHGGIGSIARALRQGCPLLIEPYGNDQFYNADRVSALGVGAAVSPFHSTVNELVHTLADHVLTPSARARARALGELLAAEDGVNTACDMIERYLQRLDAHGHLPSIYERYSPPLASRQRSAPSTATNAAGGSAPVPAAAAVALPAIPRILHQAWPDQDLPADLVSYRETWRTHHPDWEWRLWTDVESRELVRQKYGWFLPIYDGYPDNAMRAGAARYFILHHYGGLYADLDVECVRSLEPLVAGQQIVLGLEPPAHTQSADARSYGLQFVVGHAVMASLPGQPFWEHVFKLLVGFHQAPSHAGATGSCFLTKAYESYPHPEEIAVAGHEWFYPIANDKPWSALSPEWQAQVLQTAFTLPHWRGRDSRERGAPPAPEGKLTLLVRGEAMGTMAVSAEHYRAFMAKQPALPKISCVMVTRDRVAWAQRAIHCFQKQTYANCELVILDDSPSDELEQWIGRLDDARIVYTHLADEKRTLGELRNLGVDQATGEYIAQWDDDDLSDPWRLELQMAVILALHTEACFLERHQILWMPTRRLAASTRRIWEGSFVCAKAVLPRYPALRQGEDTPVIQHIVEAGRTGLLDLPFLYTYVFHGKNTFAADHWEHHWLTATESFEGPLFEIMLRVLQERLTLTLPLEPVGRSAPAD